MEQSASDEKEADPYAQLLLRLSVALAEADSVAHLGDEPPGEMDVRGLSAAELALITAYLARNQDWLKDWHATAVQQFSADQHAQQPPFRRKVPPSRTQCSGACVVVHPET